MIGGEEFIQDELILSFEDLENELIYTNGEALEYLGRNIKSYSNQPRSKKSFAEQAREKLASIFIYIIIK
jgi:hypothetical protein